MRTEHVMVIAEAAYTAGRESGSVAADHVLGILSGASNHVAAGLLAWDQDARRHRVLASPGYGAAFLAQLHQEMMDGPVFRRLVEVGQPLRFDDPPHDFRRLAVYREMLAPEGYGDGLSAALYVEGRYSGMLHMSAERGKAFDDEIRDVVAALAPSLGRLCDPAHQALDSLDEDYTAQIVVGPDIHPVAGRERSPVLTDDSAIRAVAGRFLASAAPSVRGLWAASPGWRQVVLFRVRDPRTARDRVALVGDRPFVLPYGLSPREVDVLTHVVRGSSNATIAATLGIASRTVATHIEHILAKFACDSRAAAAARATREGLVRLDMGDPAF